MAKLKKSGRAKPTAAPNAEFGLKAEQLSRSIVESAQQIWSAGVGAFARAQGEGSKMFEALVKEGMSIERSTRTLATGKVDAVRDAVEGKVGAVRERASDTWDRLEKVFEDRVQRALTRLGVPGRDEINELSAKVDTLTAVLRQPGKAAAKPAAKKAAAKPAARRPAKAARKAKPSRKPRLPKAPRPQAPAN
jgi:poly(hydroxyalkanoate) granule-associated protein